MLLESKFGLMGAFVTFWELVGQPRARQEDSLLESQMQLGSLQYPRNPMKGAFLSVLAGGHGLVPPARACFFGIDPGCRVMFFVAAPWFSTSGNAATVHFRLVGSLSIFAIETLLALHGAELPSWWGVLQLS